MRALVYVNAIVVSAGHSMMTEPVMAERFAAIAPSLQVDEEHQLSWFGPQEATQLFYNDCDPVDVALALRLLTPEPNGAMATLMDITPGRYGTLPRFGITSTNDVMLLPHVKQRLYEQDGLAEVLTLPTGHSPNLAAPAALVEQLRYFDAELN